MKESEAILYLRTLPAPDTTWLERCKGDKRLATVYVKEMGYTVEEEKKQEAEEELPNEAG